jgi:hypothetical protein
MNKCKCLDIATDLLSIVNKIRKESDKPVKSKDANLIESLRAEYRLLRRAFTLVYDCDNNCNTDECVKCYKLRMYINMFVDASERGPLTKEQKYNFIDLVINGGEACEACKCTECSDLLKSNSSYANKVLLEHIDSILPNVPTKHR